MTSLKSKIFNLWLIFILLFTISINNTLEAKAQAESSEAFYQIQQGDTLGSIATTFGISLESLVNANNISDPDSISPGDLLKIPGLIGLTGVITPVTLGLNQSLSTITSNYNVSLKALLKLNHISSLDEIYAGTSLLIPISKEIDLIFTNGNR